MEEKECMKCGHKWTPRTKEPAACPACKCYGWDKPKKERSTNVTA